MVALTGRDRVKAQVEGNYKDYVSLGGELARKGKAQSDSNVTFTQKQLAWLEETFPELRVTPETSMEAIQHHAGIRHVIHCIRQRTSSGRVVQV